MEADKICLSSGNHILEQALIYAEDFHYSVIPVGPDKKPYVLWSEYQTRPASSDEIRAWWKSWPNAMIGIITGGLFGVLVMDCDSPEGYEAIKKLIPNSLVTPIARTPRGGWHLYFAYPVGSKITVGCKVLPDVDYRGEGGYIIAPPSVNGTGKSYTWQEGAALGEVDLPPLPDALLSFIITNKAYVQENKSKQDSQGKSEQISCNQQMFTEGRRDDDIFHTANCLKKGGAKPEEIHYICNILGDNCSPPFPRNEIRLKIESALKRAERHERNIAQEVREWVQISDGHFKVSDFYRESGLVSKEDKHAAIVEFNSLKARGIIERYGKERGVYRKIENECENIDFLNAPTESVDICWPFGIERLVKTLPKNIIVIAGEPNAGKTAFLLNVVKMNQNKHKVTYFSSEMGEIELKDRLSKFDVPLTDWSFNAKERSSNFADVIKQDGLNIIDFLEIHDEFYKIGSLIKDIYDKLDKGIAIIAIQKNKLAEFGLGGGRGLEKARLYMTMEPNHLKIIKGKNWTDSAVNPSGMQIDFKLANGCKFLPQSEWYKQ